MHEVKLMGVKNDLPSTDDKYTHIISQENALKALTFHRSFPQYEITPLIKLKKLANYIGLKNIYVKDESYRFGLNAFKVLGGSYAIGQYIAEKLKKDISEVPYNVLTSKEIRNKIGQATFYTATDGNHGRGIAWAANKLGQASVIHMPKGTTRTRLENILNLGSSADITEMNYDDCVRLANSEASKDSNGIMIQDTAWDGYEKIPTWIMQGYSTLSIEADRQLIAMGCDKPTHIFIQVGVGSLAGSVIGYFANKYKENPPIMIVVEAGAADCLYKSACKKTGELVNVTGDLKTIMAGLACGEGNTISWDILVNHCDYFLSAPDWMAAKGMRIYSVPLSGDKSIISGESGAITMGVLFSIMKHKEYKTLKQALKLNENSEILLVSTEGNTDPKRFREVVWDGLYGLKDEPGASSYI